MRKNFGKKNCFYPLPVLIVGTYDENDVPNALNAAWGGMWDYNQIVICLDKHKTTDNISLKKAFTVSFADTEHVCEADYVGIISGNKVPNKLEKAGLLTKKSEFVDAPIIEAFPLTLECKLIEMTSDYHVIAEVINVSADEKVLDEKGEIDPSKLHIISYDPLSQNYVELGRVVGKAFKDGLKIK